MFKRLSCTYVIEVNKAKTARCKNKKNALILNSYSRIRAVQKYILFRSPFKSVGTYIQCLLSYGVRVLIS